MPTFDMTDWKNVCYTPSVPVAYLRFQPGGGQIHLCQEHPAQSEGKNVWRLFCIGRIHVVVHTVVFLFKIYVFVNIPREAW